MKAPAKVVKQHQSRDFPCAYVDGRPVGARYLLDAIPSELWTRARQKAAREGVSMRNVLLTLLTVWLDD